MSWDVQVDVKRVSGPLLVAVVAAALAGCGSAPVSTVAGAASSDPAVFAVAQGQSGYPPATSPVDAPAPVSSGPVLQIRSVTTGALRRDHLATNVGQISLSPDASTVYYESTAGPLDPFPIERVSVAGGRPVQVASGEDPAISPDGADLAYATGSGDAIAIDNLAHHATRLIDLTTLIGPDASFNNTPGVVAWLSANEIVAIPPDDITTGDSSTTGTSPCPPPGQERAPPCTATTSSAPSSLHLDAAQPAHVVTITLPKNFAITAAGAGPTPGTLLLGSLGTVARLAITPTAAVNQAVVTVPDDGLVEGFSPNGRHALYLRNHGPIQLWSATITTAAVKPSTELLADADLGSASW